MGVSVDAITRSQRQGPLVAIQEIGGKTLYVDQGSFSRAGLNGDEIIGIPWRDFSPPSEHAAEAAMIDTVLRTSVPAYPRVLRQWPSKTVRLVSKTSVVTSKGGTQLIMREAHIIEPAAGTPIDLLLDAQGPMAKLDALQIIAQELGIAGGLALREDWAMLHYLIDMARLEAEERRLEIQKAVLS